MASAGWSIAPYFDWKIEQKPRLVEILYVYLCTVYTYCIILHTVLCKLHVCDLHTYVDDSYVCFVTNVPFLWIGRAVPAVFCLTCQKEVIQMSPSNVGVACCHHPEKIGQRPKLAVGSRFSSPNTLRMRRTTYNDEDLKETQWLPPSLRLAFTTFTQRRRKSHFAPKTCEI